MVAALPSNRPIVRPDGTMETQTQSFMQAIANLDILAGTGAPEGIVTALQRRLYMDLAGTAGAILYIKRDADIAGDKSQGWVLV